MNRPENRGAVSFFLRVISSFRANQGLLLSGAIAYYTLLSIIPLFILLLVVLSHFVDTPQLLDIVEGNLKLLFGQQTPELVHQLERFLQFRETVGWMGLLILLFFSSMAFTVLENAMSVIFFHRVRIHRRHFLVSAIIPYVYILALGIGVLLVSLISGALDVWEGETITLFVWTFELKGLTATALYLLGVIGLILLLSSIYLVMPIGGITPGHALLGGVVAAVLWEIARHILVWYFSTLSLVNLIYGTLASAIVALLFLEVAAMILLFGAQVIAEYERRDEAVADEGAFRT
jgi:membrane protein